MDATARRLPPSELAHLGPLLGETAWHSVTVDATIEDRSREQLARLRHVLARHAKKRPPRQILEVASYALTHGYALAAELGAEVTLFDISPSTLALGRELAGSTSRPPRLVAGDYHDLPFENAAFDFVCIASALHHTRDWPRVLAEMQRVLAPGGLLYLDNEPCARACCCYRFETNRPAELTPFERELDRLGILQTVAQPFAGSRPESLFGMVENEHIELPAVLARLRQGMEVLDLQIDVATQIGPLEHGWLGARSSGLNDRIRRELEAACAQVAPRLDAQARGLGFSLPEPAELAALASRTAAAIAALPRPPLLRRWLRRLRPAAAPAASAAGVRAPRWSAATPRQQALAQIFGGSLRVVARKHGNPPADAHGRLREEFPVRDGIHRAFDPAIAAMLDGHVRLFTPPLHGDRSSMFDHFEPADWQHVLGENGVHCMLLRGNEGRIHLPLLAGEAILVLRCHGAPPAPGHATVTVHAGTNLLFRHELWQAESFLCVARIKPADGGELALRAGTAGGAAHLDVAVATLHPVPATGRASIRSGS